MGPTLIALGFVAGAYAVAWLVVRWRRRKRDASYRLPPGWKPVKR